MNGFFGMDNDDRELTALFEGANKEFDDRHEFAEAVLQRVGRERLIRATVLAIAVVAGGVLAAAPIFQALVLVIEFAGAGISDLVRQPFETQLRILAALTVPFVAAGVFRWLER